MSFFRQLLNAITAPFRLILGLPLQVVSGPRRLMGMSLPARVAALVALFLVICTVLYATIRYFEEGRAEFLEYWRSIVGLAVLSVVIPVILYYTIKLWLEGNQSRFPDIDAAWREGIAELAGHGLDPTLIPIFLVLGVGDERQAKALMDASGRSFSIGGAPSGRAALHWYASPDAIFLVCTDVSQLGRLTRLAGQTVPAAAQVAPGGAPAGGGVRGTIVAGMPNDGRGTMMQSEPAAPAPGQRAQLTGTLMVGAEGEPSARGAGAPSSGLLSLPSAEAAELTARLEYVCQLLGRLRQPVCPANGILTLLPFEVIQRGPAEGVQVQRAATGDLETVARGLQLRCPVTAVMGGMEVEAGFRELVRRVGPDRAKAQRFGKGFNVWNVPTPEQVEAVGAHACGAFEDWAYLLFREKDGLTRPGNTKLYGLLCKVRTHLRTRLINILVSAYADESDAGRARSGSQGMLFSGCYFAATGDSPDRQAFVKSVFDKLVDEEEELEWADEALVENDRYHRLAQFVMAVDGLLLLGLIGLLAKRWFF